MTARKDAQRDAFMRYVSEWNQLRADISNPEEVTDEAALVRDDWADELARLITTTPAVLPWMIFEKWEVLEHYLADSDGSTWTDNRQVVMLAGIKADLLRFKLQER